MRKEPFPLDYVASKLDNEGVGYAIQHYFGRNLDSESDELNKAWREAFDALEKVKSLFPNLGF
jgi:hypothetical protein